MRISRAALAATLSLAATTAGAQVVPNIVELEGPINSITCTKPVGYDPVLQDTGCTEVVMNVMGTTVLIPEGTPVSSPSAELTLDLLADTKALLGNPNGFVGGTAKLTGISTANGPVADNVLVELSENVFLGSVTANDQVARPRVFKVEGTDVVLLPGPTGPSFPAGQAAFDERLPGLPLKNDYGFRINGATIPVGSLVAAEGYYDVKRDPSRRKFYAFSMEVTGGQLLSSFSQVSILRAQCRVRSATEIELEVRGATYEPANGTVELFSPARRAADGTLIARAVTYGRIQAVPDVGDFGVYNFDVRMAPPAGSTGCPSTLRAWLVDATDPASTAQRVQSPAAVVDIRVD